MVPEICPRCNNPWDKHISDRVVLPERYISNCGLIFLPDEYSFHLVDHDWNNFVRISWRSHTALYRKHCQIELSNSIIHSFDSWLPFDITEDGLNKLLCLV